MAAEIIGDCLSKLIQASGASVLPPWLLLNQQLFLAPAVLSWRAIGFAGIPATPARSTRQFQSANI